MFDWLVEKYFALIKSVPPLFTVEGSASFTLARAMVGLLVIVALVYLIAMRPFRLALARCFERATAFMRRKN